MAKLTLEEYLAKLSPTERENPRAVSRQKILYKIYAEQVSLYGNPANLLEK